jgi:YjbE family integral membrane protein
MPLKDGRGVNSAFADAARLFEIIGANILLSGDNAVVVGMAIRSLPAAQGRVASAAGISAAVLVQIVVTLTVARLLALPAVSLPAALLLCAIAIRLLRNNGGLAQPALWGHSEQGLLGSIATVTVVYFIMCPDNILAIAAVGRGHPWLLTAGLLLSTALIIPASLVIANLMRRYPITLTAGAAILGWIGGSLLAGALPWLAHLPIGPLQFMIPAVTVVIVITSPVWWRHTDQKCRVVDPMEIIDEPQR